MKRQLIIMEIYIVEYESEFLRKLVALFIPTKLLHFCTTRKNNFG